MFISDFWQFFFLPIISCVFFIIFLLMCKFLSKNIAIYFFVATIVIILLAFSDSLQNYFSTFSYPTNQRKFFASLSYTLRVSILLLMILLFARDQSKKFKIIASIPAIINMIISFLSFAWDKVFYYTEENVLVRGPLISTPFIVSGLYFLILFYVIYKTNSKSRLPEIITVFCTLIVSTITTLMEAKGGYKGVLSNSSIFSISFYYMFFLTNNYAFDQLTGAYVRNKLYKFVEENNRRFAIITLDANGLKKLNDTFGHLEGDKCLTSIVKAVNKVIDKHTSIYRLGGDEFVVIYNECDPNSIENLILNIKDQISKTSYSASIGYSIKEVDETFEAALNRADEMMYIEKDIYHNSLKS